MHNAPLTLRISNNSHVAATVLVEYWWVDKYFRSSLFTVNAFEKSDTAAPCKPVRITIGNNRDNNVIISRVFWKSDTEAFVEITDADIAKTTHVPFIDFCKTST